MRSVLATQAGTPAADTPKNGAVLGKRLAKDSGISSSEQ